MLDMERARMTAEDYRQGNARCDHNPNFMTWRALEHCQTLRLEEADQTIKNIANVVKRRGHSLTAEDCFSQIRAEVQAHGLLDSSDEEMSDEDSMFADQEDEEEIEEVQCVLCHIMIGRHVVMADQPGRWAGLAYHDRIVCRQCYDADPEVRRMDEELARTANDAPVYCEACDGYYRQGVVAWYTEPFTHDGRNLYSACGVCRWRLNLEDRPVLHW